MVPCPSTYLIWALCETHPISDIIQQASSFYTHHSHLPIEQLLEIYPCNNQTIWLINISDLGGGRAIFYLSNRVTRPPIPIGEDFFFNLSALTFDVYYLNNWRRVTIGKMESFV